MLFLGDGPGGIRGVHLGNRRIELGVGLGFRLLKLLAPAGDLGKRALYLGIAVLDLRLALFQLAFLLGNLLTRPLYLRRTAFNLRLVGGDFLLAGIDRCLRAIQLLFGAGELVVGGLLLFVDLGCCILADLLAARLLAFGLDALDLLLNLAEQRLVLLGIGGRALRVLRVHVHGGENVGAYGIGRGEELVVGAGAGAHGDGPVGVGELGGVDHRANDNVVGALEHLGIARLKRNRAADLRPRIGKVVLGNGHLVGGFRQAPFQQVGLVEAALQRLHPDAGALAAQLRVGGFLVGAGGLFHPVQRSHRAHVLCGKPQGALNPQVIEALLGEERIG